MLNLPVHRNLRTIGISYTRDLTIISVYRSYRQGCTKASLRTPLGAPRGSDFTYIYPIQVDFQNTPWVIKPQGCTIGSVFVLLKSSFIWSLFLLISLSPPEFKVPMELRGSIYSTRYCQSDNKSPVVPFVVRTPLLLLLFSKLHIY